MEQTLAIKDQKLFLGLFVQDNNVYDLSYLGKVQVSPVSIEEKVEHEINDINFQLVQGYPIVFNEAFSLPTSLGKKVLPTHINRTICLLNGLRHFFRDKELNDLLNDDSLNAPPKINVKYKVRKVRECIVEVQPIESIWTLSYPLLLIQAVRFSQIEWDNHDYNFEYFSAIRACNELDSFFKKEFFSYEGNQQAFDAILRTFKRLIRWFTLNGQFIRESSCFNSYHIGLKLTDEEKILLNVLLYADEFLRKEEYHNEKLTRKYIKEEAIDKLLADAEFIEEKCENKFVLPKKKEYQELLAFLKKNESQPKELKIFSNLTIRHLKPNEPFNQSIRKHFSSQEVANNSNSIAHFVVDKTQRQMGILRKLKDKLENVSEPDFKKYFDHRKLKALAETGTDMILSPREYIYLVYVKPRYVLELIHDFQFSDDPATATDYLEMALGQAYKKYGNKLPLPITNFILNLLPYYNTRSVGSNGFKSEAFHASITFNGKKTITFWLPEVNDNGVQLKEKKIETEYGESISIKDILERFIHYTVTNYGMISHYSRVDLDFSDSVNFEKGFWDDTLKKGKKKYGIHVYERYLEDCASSILETSYSIELYQRFIKPRKLVTPYLVDFFPELVSDKDSQLENGIKIEDKLKDKYILGIDIGATGIKMKFFRIVRKNEDILQGYAFFDLNEYPPKLKKQRLLNLTPEPDEYVIPTTRIGGKFRDEADFASYIIKNLQLQTQENGLWQKYSKALISIGIAWPGPIKQNKIATTSGILKNFEGFTPMIMQSRRDKVTSLDIAQAVQDVFEKTMVGEVHVKVAMANDGDVEAAGFAFGIVNNLNSRDDSTIDNLKKIVDDNNVAIIKAGTGTAGAILVDGRIKGLNEFGKIIADLAADNRLNIQKIRENDLEHIWPAGDVNKFFSMNFLKEEARKAGVPGSVSGDITGRDLDLLFKETVRNEGVRGGEKAFKYTLIEMVDGVREKLFGALELIELAKPKIKWEQLVGPGKKIRKNISLQYNEQEKFTILEGKDMANKEIEDYVWYNFTNLERIANLQFSIVKPLTFNELLSQLGKTRIARFNILKLIADKESKDILQKIGEHMGERLADTVGLIHQIRPLKLVILAGGPLRSKAIGYGCKAGLETSIKGYLHNRFYAGFEALEKYAENKADDNKEEKVYYYYQGEDYALLGAALLGFDHYVIDEKLKELQKLAKQEEGHLLKQTLYLSLQEAEWFVKENASKLRLTYNPRDHTINCIKTKYADIEADPLTPAENS